MNALDDQIAALEAELASGSDTDSQSDGGDGTSKIR